MQTTETKGPQLVRPGPIGLGIRVILGAAVFYWFAALLTHTWQVLASVLRTAAQHQRDPVAILVGLLGAPGPTLADLVVPTPARDPEAHRASRTA